MSDGQAARSRGGYQNMTREQLLDALVEYDRRINWHTTCENCANLLDKSYADYAKAEQFREAVQQFADEWKTRFYSFGTDDAGFNALHKILESE